MSAKQKERRTKRNERRAARLYEIDAVSVSERDSRLISACASRRGRTRDENSQSSEIAVRKMAPAVSSESRDFFDRLVYASARREIRRTTATTTTASDSGGDDNDNEEEIGESYSVRRATEITVLCAI